MFVCLTPGGSSFLGKERSGKLRLLTGYTVILRLLNPEVRRQVHPNGLYKRNIKSSKIMLQFSRNDGSQEILRT